jgi:hypothetical protein
MISEHAYPAVHECLNIKVFFMLIILGIIDVKTGHHGNVEGLQRLHLRCVEKPWVILTIQGSEGTA